MSEFVLYAGGFILAIILLNMFLGLVAQTIIAIKESSK